MYADDTCISATGRWSKASKTSTKSGQSSQDRLDTQSNPQDVILMLALVSVSLCPSLNYFLFEAYPSTATYGCVNWLGKLGTWTPKQMQNPQPIPDPGSRVNRVKLCDLYGGED